MELLQLAICDDRPEERQALLALLEQAPIPTARTQFGSSEELLNVFRPGMFDLLLIDIYMDGMTGVEAVRKIRALDEHVPIAFTTTSTEHTLESYRLSVLKYLEKPVRQKDVNDLLRLVKLQKDGVPRLVIRQNGERQRLPLSELMFLEQKAHHVLLSVRNGGTIQLYGKLSDLLPQLEGQSFFCPHKSYCVNLAFVRGINEEFRCYEMADGKKVPISRPNRIKAKRAYEHVLFARTRGMDDGAAVLHFLHHAAYPYHSLCPVLEFPMALPHCGSGTGECQCAVQNGGRRLLSGQWTVFPQSGAAVCGGRVFDLLLLPAPEPLQNDLHLSADGGLPADHPGRCRVPGRAGI